MKKTSVPAALSAAKALLILAGFGVTLALYLRIAEIQSGVNQNLGKVDQFAYLDFAKRAHASNFAFTGWRNRMPLYPWMQALFYSPEMSDEAFFESGKDLNTLLSIACIALLGAAFFRQFAKSYALYAMAVIALLCFAIKAPWFQAEVLFYTLFAFAYMLSIEAIRRPAWWKSIGLGLLLALAHFTKASALPALALCVCSCALPLLYELRHRPTRGRIYQLAFQAIAPLAVFFIALFPYFSESKDRYGQYLYNVNSTFYVWYDSWGEAKFGTKAAGDREGWPDLPDEEIPSMAKYLAEHSAADIARRLAQGAERIHKNACSGADSPSQFGLCLHAGAGILILTICLAARLRASAGRFTIQAVQCAIFAALFFALYLLMFWWFAAIASGPRFILSLLIPLLWTVGLAVRSAPGVTLPGTDISLTDAVIAVMLIILLSQIYELAAARAAILFGGF